MTATTKAIQNRQWLRKEEGHYYLLIDEAVNAELTIKESWRTLRSGVVQLGEATYTLKKQSLWTNAFNLYDEDGTLLLEVRQPKWHESDLEFDYGDYQYRLTTQHSPLTKYVLYRRDEVVLTYKQVLSKQGLGRFIEAWDDDLPLLLDVLLQFVFPSNDWVDTVFGFIFD